MLQELAASTDASVWVIASMLFFLGVWAFIAIRTFRARPEEMEARARLVLEGETGAEIPSGPARDA
jgi:hypothetical protein